MLIGKTNTLEPIPGKGQILGTVKAEVQAGLFTSSKAHHSTALWRALQCGARLDNKGVDEDKEERDQVV